MWAEGPARQWKDICHLSFHLRGIPEKGQEDLKAELWTSGKIRVGISPINRPASSLAQAPAHSGHVSPGSARLSACGCSPRPWLPSSLWTGKCQCRQQRSFSQECPSVSTWQNLQSAPRYMTRSVALTGSRMTVNASSAWLACKSTPPPSPGLAWVGPACGAYESERSRT
ncbi:hypothetical protein J1605_020869 [Eschrichtius robustus]|uniref:Uncharacterized protein n=1 Tax=Eschrichtius robustus TaxID=9764 RepID=A0AB34HIN3_ESCRO|nr:hypothetical protein J1605_020869 [Eschrichtius robustus]